MKLNLKKRWVQSLLCLFPLCKHKANIFFAETLEHFVKLTVEQLQQEYAQQHAIRMKHIQKLNEQIIHIGKCLFKYLQTVRVGITITERFCVCLGNSVLETYRAYDVQSQRIHQLSVILINLHNKLLNHQPFLDELKSLKEAVKGNYNCFLVNFGAL
jgi:hypothetical protein